VKLITEILNEEIKTLKHASMSTWETDPSWSSVASRRPLDINNARQPNSYRDTQPIESTNMYAILTNIPETSILQGKNEPKMTKSTHISTNNYVQKETNRRIRNPLPNPPPKRYQGVNKILYQLLSMVKLSQPRQIITSTERTIDVTIYTT
jgi:hypothetical protein